MIYCSKVILRNEFTNKNHSHYVGLTESSLKIDYINIKTLLNTRTNFIWDQNSKNIKVSLEYSILDKAKPYSPGSRNRMLSLTGKYHILILGLNIFDKRNELVSQCRHASKYYLSNYKSVPP